MISVRGILNLPMALGFRAISDGPNLQEYTSPRTQNKYSTENLAYPLNVEGDPQQGHYISFYARVTSPAKLKAFKEAKAAKAFIKEAEASPEGFKAEDVQAARKLVEENKQSSGSKYKSIRLSRETTVRTKTAISLYMPPSVQVSYESKYGDQEISLLAETGYNAISAFMRGDTAKEQVMSVLGDAGHIVKNMALAAIETAAPGSKALFAIHQGKVITPKMELMFEGIGRRNFSFAFVFIPKSEQEAAMVGDIVHKFKHHMAADYLEGTNNREMKFPDMFDIEYMHIGKRNPHLNRISTCALTKLDVEYGGDRYVAYEGGVPQTTKLSLSFTEFEIITKKRIEAGY